MQEVSIRSRSHVEMIDITAEVQRALDREKASASGGQAGAGICTVFVPHTTAGVTINENADPSVRADILAALDRAIPGDAGYRHEEGNAAAHMKASLVGSSASVPVEDGRLCLGTWQGIFFCEFEGPRERRIWIQTR
jgi:secondary thiamine-phosphate synthase enzyme